jgi:hypothetical protein
MFDHEFERKISKCLYRLDGDRITVIVDSARSIAYLDGMRPERLANVLAREILVAASFRSRLNPGLTRLEKQPTARDPGGDD